MILREHVIVASWWREMVWVRSAVEQAKTAMQLVMANRMREQDVRTHKSCALDLYREDVGEGQMG